MRSIGRLSQRRMSLLDSLTIYGREVHSSRQSRICAGCFRNWPPGSRLVVWEAPTPDESSWQRYWMCEVCMEYVASAPMRLRNGGIPLSGFVHADVGGYKKIESRFDMQLIVLRAGLRPATPRITERVRAFSGD